MTLNNENKLKLKQRSSLLIVELKEGKTIAIPVRSSLRNARVLDVFPDGAFTAHWKENFNTFGDFRSELMTFDSNLVLDEMDLKKRNKLRVANGLMPIE